MDIIFNRIIRNRSINRIRMGKEQEMKQLGLYGPIVGGVWWYVGRSKK